MKNYYEELEVSKTASKEVIEKVYKLLAKKYHPDTTKEIDKHVAEEKFKIISEAYEVLSDDNKRRKYDLELEQFNPTISYDEYIQVVEQRDYLNNSLIELRNTYNNSNDHNNNNNYYNTNTSNINNTNYTNETYHNNYTKESGSTFSYYISKFKEFVINIGLLFLSIIIALLIINYLFNF